MQQRPRPYRPLDLIIPTGGPRLLTTHRNLPTLHRSLDSSPRDLGGEPWRWPPQLSCDPVLEAFWLHGARRRESVFRKIQEPPSPSLLAVSQQVTLQLVPFNLNAGRQPSASPVLSTSILSTAKPEEASVRSHVLPTYPVVHRWRRHNRHPPPRHPTRGVRDGKSGRRTAYPQRIVATRPLYRLQDRFAQLSRLQRI